MKRTIAHSIIPLLVIISSIFISSCSLDVDLKNEPITEEDLIIVSQIIAESLSDANAGAVSAMHDAVSGISANGFALRKNALEATDLQELSGRGTETNVQYFYDPLSGEHILRFDRMVDLPNYQKTQTDSLIYVYRKLNGELISDPESDALLIASIRFFGSREGQITQPTSSSTFVRHDTLFIRGLDQSSDRIYMNGSHVGEGTYNALVGPDSVLVERVYEIKFNFLDIELPKDTPLPTQRLDRSLRGLITYSVEIAEPSNPNQIRTLNGRIDLVGDGTATLNLEETNSTYQVNLGSGSSKDQEDEFEGRIRSVQLNLNRFSISSGLVIQLNATTEIDQDGDLVNLEQVQQAISQNTDVWAEGEGQLVNRIFEATKITFELDDDEGDDDEGRSDSDVEFEQRIESIDQANKVLKLISGLTLRYDQNTQILSESEFNSFGEVVAALNRSISVEAEGYAAYFENESIPLLIKEIEFEQKSSGSDGDSDGDDDDDDDSDEDQEIEGILDGLNIGQSLISLRDGNSIRFDDQTELEIQDDEESLQTVLRLLNQGVEIEVKAKVIADSTQKATYYALELSMEWEEEDD